MMLFQSGKYNEPEWLSADSKRLIKSMLQTDPKNRISIEKLVRDPWMMVGYDRPVSKDNVCDVSKIHTIIQFYTFFVLNEQVEPISVCDFITKPTQQILMKFGIGNLHCKFKRKFNVCIVVPYTSYFLWIPNIIL